MSEAERKVFRKGIKALERLLKCSHGTGQDTETDRAMKQAQAALQLATTIKEK